MQRTWTRGLESVIFAARWILYPINIGLMAALFVYVIAFLHNDYIFLRYDCTWGMETLMVALLGFVDASMVANMVVMVVQGSHQIFIHKFSPDKELRPQWLDHIDSGQLKVKTALSIAGITLVQILKDFANLEHVEWMLVVHRIIIHVVALCSALMMAFIWRVTHPEWAVHNEVQHEEHT